MASSAEIFRKVGRWLRIAAEGFVLLSLIGVLLLRLFPPPFTWLMVIRATEADYPRRPILWGSYAPIEKISKHVLRAVITSEDQKFAEHLGFDFEAISKVSEMNSQKAKKRLRGASTITQQTAKNAFLWPKRTYLRKGLEAWFTVLIELFWGKKHILEMYLNIIEMGPGTYGVTQWAQRYYETTPEKINPYQAALLAASLPNPRKWNPKSVPWNVRAKQGWILYLMPKAQLPE